MDEVSAELKAMYTLYAPLWGSWTSAYECTLPEHVIYFINAQVNNGFIIAIDNAMFHYTLPLLRRLQKI